MRSTVDARSRISNRDLIVDKITNIIADQIDKTLICQVHIRVLTLKLGLGDARPQQALHFASLSSRHYGSRLVRLLNYMVYQCYDSPLPIIFAALVVQQLILPLRGCRHGLRFKSNSQIIMISSRLSSLKVFLPPLPQHDTLAVIMTSLLLVKWTGVIGLRAVSEVRFYGMTLGIY